MFHLNFLSLERFSSVKNVFRKCTLFIYDITSQWMKRFRTWSLRFPAKENPNMGKALFDWLIVLQYDVKAKYRLFLESSRGMKFSSSRALAQPTKSSARLYPFDKPIKSLYFLSFASVLFALSLKSPIMGVVN